jgi:hypothetical protein
MKTLWLIQSNGFRDSYLFEIAESLKRFNIEFKDFGVVKNNSITNLTEILKPEYADYNFITRGGTKFLGILEKLREENKDLSYFDNKLSKEIIQRSDFWIDKLLNSVDYDVNKFDQLNYSKLDLPLLNSDARYINYSRIKDYEFSKETFIKPSRDLKSFNGGVIYAGETIQNYIARTGYSSPNIKTEKIVVSDIKEIQEEYRFFMYKNKILGCYRYMLDSEVNPSDFVPEDIKECAIKYSELYNPSELYVMDLAVTLEGIKIVEYNCWNASGFYHCNIRDIIFQVNEFKAKMIESLEKEEKDEKDE